MCLVFFNHEGGGGLIWSFSNSKNLHFENEENDYINSLNYEENGYRYGLDQVIIALITYFKSYEKWVQREMYPFETCLP